MKLGIIAGLGTAFALLSGGASNAAEANASVPIAAAPIPLVPEVYTASSALSFPAASLQYSPVAPIAITPSAMAVAVAPPTVATRPSSPPAPVTAEGRAVPAPVIKSNQYHPHWVIALH
jgi:hypothetical protein